MNEELVQVVKDKLCFIMKDSLVSYALEKGIVNKASVTKEAVVSAISMVIDLNMAYDLIGRFGNIGFNFYEVEKRLNISSMERKKWTKKGLLKVTGSYQTRAYGKYLDCPIYDPCQTLTLSQEKISEWRASLCYRCINRKKAYERRKYWISNKDKYLILDTETTGLGYSDQIIEIAIIDLDGNILFNSFVRPTVDIGVEAYYVHGISHECLVKNNAPYWDEIYLEVRKILKNKTVIAYNSDFDKRMIYQSCNAFDLCTIETNYECLMSNVMLEYSSDYYISLAGVVDSPQSHRAVDDCFLCLEIVNKN